MGKKYIYYQRISIKEGLDIGNEKIHLDNSTRVYQKNVEVATKYL